MVEFGCIKTPRPSGTSLAECLHFLWDLDQDGSFLILFQKGVFRRVPDTIKFNLICVYLISYGMIFKLPFLFNILSNRIFTLH